MHQIETAGGTAADRPASRWAKRTLGGFAVAAAMLSSTSAYAINCAPGAGAFGGTDLYGLVTSATSALNAGIDSAQTAFQAQGNAFIGAPANARPGSLGAGSWVRGIGGSLDVESNTRGVGTVVAAGVVGPSGPFSCNAVTHLDYRGFQVGQDIARLNINGWNFFAGGTAGYVSMGAKDTVNSLTFQEGGSAQLEVPFVGGYAAVTGHGWFADVLVRADFFQNSITAVFPTIPGFFSGLNDQRFDARSISVSSSIGYTHTWSNYFVEPSAGFTYSRTRIDPLANAFSPVFLGAGGLVDQLTSIYQFDDVESMLARASLRFGTTLQTGRFAFQPFGVVSVFHEFADDATAVQSLRTSTGLFAAPGTLIAVSATSTDRIGTYGQFGAGLAAALIDTGWVAYARGDYRYGERIEGFSVNTGLRYHFAPTALPVAAKF